MTTSRTRPKTPLYPLLSDKFAESFKKVASGENAQEVLDSAAKTIEAEIKKYKK